MAQILHLCTSTMQATLRKIQNSQENLLKLAKKYNIDYNIKKREIYQGFIVSFKPVYTNKAPKPVGPYSQALKAGPWLFCSGQIPLDRDGQVVGQNIETQTKQVFKNIKAVLEAENMDFNNIVKVMVFLTDIKEFPQFNRIYTFYFLEHKPVRSLVEVSSLPKSVKVEVEVTAFKSN